MRSGIRSGGQLELPLAYSRKYDSQNGRIGAVYQMVYFRAFLPSIQLSIDFNQMRTVILLLALLVLSLQAISTCQGKPNPFPTINASFTKVESHQFGQKYVYFTEDIPQQFSLLRLWGNSYQAGFAYGALMKRELRENYDSLWKYYYTLAEEEFKFITKVPQQYQPLARRLAIKLLKSLLRWNHYITLPHTPKRFLDEYAGIAAGSGLDYFQMIEVNMIPEYTRAGCSIIGAWGKATANGHLVQLRALDWDVRNPMNKYPILVVYNLTEKGSHPFVNIGFTGVVGSITGFSEYTGFSEKVRKQNPVKQNETRYGKPWTYVTRDLLQFSQNIEGALQAINQTKRTCSIYLGVGNAKSNTFRLIEYSHKQFHVFDDKNFPYTSNHGQWDNVAFMSVHEDGSSCFNDLVRDNYGSISAEFMVNVMSASHKTGDTHNVAFDYNTKELYFQVSYINKLAFQRPTLRIPMADFFKF